jgi:N-acetylneuraminic acid mutarotase
VYDPGTDRWAPAAALPLGRSSFAGASFRGRFVVLGGEDAGEHRVYSEVDVFDPATGGWSRGPDLPAGRQGMQAVAVGDRLLVPGGGPTAGGTQQAATLLELG